jgi:hypothetical protein
MNRDPFIWRRALSQLEFARAEISLRGAQDHCNRPETTDTDPGIAASKDDYSLETFILSADHYQIELLTNLDQVPEARALVVVSFSEPERRIRFPRAGKFAVLP